MGDTWITDMTDFADALDPAAEAPRPALNIAKYFGRIVEAATAQQAREPLISQVRCRRRPGRRPCPGRIRVVIESGAGPIHWSCTHCDDNGVLSGWSGTRWDRTSGSPETPPADIVRFPQIAQPNIEQLLEQFLEDQASSLKPRTLARYRDVVQLLQHYLDGHAYQSLDKGESSLLDRHFEATGSNQRSFCRLFGADKITENLGGFLGYFMIRKVVAGEQLKRAAGTVSKKLAHWLEQRGLVDAASAREAAKRGGEAARDLPRAERAAMLLADHVAASDVEIAALEDDDYVDFEQFTVTKVEPGHVWLSSGWDDQDYGPLPIPEEASRLIGDGWEISCALGRVRGRWRLVQVGNLYPM